MICDDITYVRADTAEEAVGAWIAHTLPERGGADGVRYLSGGTEIVTGARKAAGAVRVLIDIGRIPETRVLGPDGDTLFFGASLALNEIGDSRLFPLMTAAVRRIADRTVRNRLSLGGNAAGSLPYREALLPLLLAGASVRTLAPGSARRERPLSALFDKRLALEPGELVLGFSLPAAAAALPWRHYRATRTGPVDYPLVTACFLAATGTVQTGTNPAGTNPAGPVLSVAVSGFHPYPVLYPSTAAARLALDVPGTGRNDQRASAAYRRALLADMIDRAEKELS